MVLTWLAHAPFRTSFTPSPVCNTTLGMTCQFPKAAALSPVASHPREGKQPPQKRTGRFLGQLLWDGLRIPSSPSAPALRSNLPKPLRALCSFRMATLKGTGTRVSCDHLYFIVQE